MKNIIHYDMTTNDIFRLFSGEKGVIVNASQIK